MKFSKLMLLPGGKQSNIIPLHVLRGNGIRVPEDVLKQVYSEHGKNLDFQDQYATVDLNKIRWQKLLFPASRIVKCTYYPGFKRWFDSVASRTDDCSVEGWSCVDSRKHVRDHWQNEKTWMVSPIFINGHIINQKHDLHLVEGHTRIGLLIGLIKHQIVSEESKNIIWYGNYSEK